MEKEAFGHGEVAGILLEPSNPHPNGQIKRMNMNRFLEIMLSYRLVTSANQYSKATSCLSYDESVSTGMLSENSQQTSVDTKSCLCQTDVSCFNSRSITNSLSQAKRSSRVLPVPRKDVPTATLAPESRGQNMVLEPRKNNMVHGSREKIMVAESREKIMVAESREKVMVAESREKIMVAESKESYVVPESRENNMAPESKGGNAVPELTGKTLVPESREKDIVTSSPSRQTPNVACYKNVLEAICRYVSKLKEFVRTIRRFQPSQLNDFITLFADLLSQFCTQLLKSPDRDYDAILKEFHTNVSKDFRSKRLWKEASGYQSKSAEKRPYDDQRRSPQSKKVRITNEVATASSKSHKTGTVKRDSSHYEKSKHESRVNNSDSSVASHHRDAVSLHNAGKKTSKNIESKLVGRYVNPNLADPRVSKSSVEDVDMRYSPSSPTDTGSDVDVAIRKLSCSGTSPNRQKSSRPHASPPCDSMLSDKGSGTCMSDKKHTLDEAVAVLSNLAQNFPYVQQPKAPLKVVGACETVTAVKDVTCGPGVEEGRTNSEPGPVDVKKVMTGTSGTVKRAHATSAITCRPSSLNPAKSSISVRDPKVVKNSPIRDNGDSTCLTREDSEVGRCESLETKQNPDVSVDGGTKTVLSNQNENGVHLSGEAIAMSSDSEKVEKVEQEPGEICDEPTDRVYPKSSVLSAPTKIEVLQSRDLQNNKSSPRLKTFCLGSALQWFTRCDASGPDAEKQSQQQLTPVAEKQEQNQQYSRITTQISTRTDTSYRGAYFDNDLPADAERCRVPQSKQELPLRSLMDCRPTDRYYPPSFQSFGGATR